MATRRKPANHGGTKVRQRPRAVHSSDAHYSGDLAQPLEPVAPPAHILRASPDEFADFCAQLDKGRMAEIRRRVDLLFAHYKLDRDDFIGLALALAFAHVPGFQVAPLARRRGRPTKQQSDVQAAIRKARMTGQNELLAIARTVGATGRIGKPGKPVEWNSAKLRALVAKADKWKQAQRKPGVRASDRAWIQAACKERARVTGERESVVYRRESRRLANALSRARRSVSKP